MQVLKIYITQSILIAGSNRLIIIIHILAGLIGLFEWNSSFVTFVL